MSGVYPCLHIRSKKDNNGFDIADYDTHKSVAEMIKDASFPELKGISPEQALIKYDITYETKKCIIPIRNENIYTPVQALVDKCLEYEDSDSESDSGPIPAEVRQHMNQALAQMALSKPEPEKEIKAKDLNATITVRNDEIIIVLGN